MEPGKPTSAKVQAIALLLFLLAVFGISFYTAITKESTLAYSFATIVFLCLFALCASEFLQYKVDTQLVSLSREVTNLEQQNKELRSAVSALLKTLYVIEHGSSVWSGVTESHWRLIDGYLEPIQHLVAGNPKAEAAGDIAKLGQAKS